MSKKWNDLEINEAIILLKNKLDFEEIGKNLNRTTKSVRVKLNRLGYKEHKYKYWAIKKCKCCDIEFNSLKSENRDYCSKSCSAKINNKIYPKRNKTINFVDSKGNLNERKRNEYYNRKTKPCLNCGKITTNKYCNSTCQQKYKRKIIFKKIENDESTKYLGNCGTQSRWVKKYLIEKYGEKCMKCGWDERHCITNKVPIELEHKDGNSENNSLDNLELLCPNCHSLTLTYKALNAGNGRHKRRERYKEGKSF